MHSKVMSMFQPQEDRLKEQIAQLKEVEKTADLNFATKWGAKATFFFDGLKKSPASKCNDRVRGVKYGWTRSITIGIEMTGNISFRLAWNQEPAIGLQQRDV